ncbi:hypothetical protein CPB83DRAFT_854171 [Crepidotus variabilis]|uniref:VOC domain-containing protein n=1 Tax=Crepidotus variabilis TaxID=179855 RepID=A0A9P6EGG7_9AGAR|nr:hypothetical protein CPB83DRAFT_854171 [Crepidotus variabilis]
MSTNAESSSSKHAFGVPCWLEVSVTNVPAAKTFYESIFNWKFRPANEAFPAEDRAIFINSSNPTMGGTLVKASEVEGGQTPGPKNSVVVFVHVDDVDDTLTKIKAAGGSVEMAKITVGGHTELAKYKDLDGNIGGVLKWLM